MPECTISGYPCCEASVLLHWNQNDVWERFRAFRLPSACKKMQNLCSHPNALYQGTKVVKHPFESTGPKMMFGTVSEHFAKLWHVKRCETCVSHPNELFWGTQVAKHPFSSIGTKMMFGSISEHFAYLRHVKRCKTCVSGQNALFRGTKLAKHPF
jgi:hypothetical protein